MPDPSPLSTVPPTVLVVDDEKNIRRILEMVLSGEGYRVLEAESGEKALETLGNPHEPVDVAIFDLKLPGMSGLDALQRLRADDATRDLPVIVVSGHATVHDAVAAIKLGATDFFEKPLNRERVLVSVRNSIRTARLNRTVEQMRGELEARYEMIGTSAPIQKLFQDVDKVAPTKANVLITGESGTGKELVSRAVHRLSPRRDAPFVKVNCAAMPRELIESELFGHERGAFTGALGVKRGLFEQAHGGTLFLDEIGDMDLTAQAKVLRVLQNGELARVGSEHIVHVDVRVLAATNKDLSQQVAQGRFREDLFFRLDVFPIRTPALRERRVDIGTLADAFVVGFCRENGLRAKKIDTITVADLPEDPHASPFEEDGDAGAAHASVEVPGQHHGERLTLRAFRESAERQYILETLRAFEWNISKASIALGVERTNLHKKIRAYGIKRGEG